MKYTVIYYNREGYLTAKTVVGDVYGWINSNKDIAEVIEVI